MTRTAAGGESEPGLGESLRTVAGVVAKGAALATKEALIGIGQDAAEAARKFEPRGPIGELAQTTFTLARGVGYVARTGFEMAREPFDRHKETKASWESLTNRINPARIGSLRLNEIMGPTNPIHLSTNWDGNVTDDDATVHRRHRFTAELITPPEGPAQWRFVDTYADSLTAEGRAIIWTGTRYPHPIGIGSEAPRLGATVYDALGVEIEARNAQAAIAE